MTAVEKRARRPGATSDPVQRLKQRQVHRRHTSLAAFLLREGAAAVDSAGRVHCTGQSLTSLGTVEPRFRRAKALYLSKNRLQSLDGVEHFAAELRALSCADNCLSSFDALHPLAALKALEAASFEGNPVSLLPHYRAHVIGAAGPSLASLDGRPVTAEERGAALGTLALEARALAAMVRSACMVHSLHAAVTRRQLHRELGARLAGPAPAPLPPSSEAEPGAEPRPGPSSSRETTSPAAGACRLLQLWDYEGRLGPEERQAVEAAILREVARTHHRRAAAAPREAGSARAWQQAFAQVMLGQVQAIGALFSQLEEGSAVLEERGQGKEKGPPSSASRDRVMAALRDGLLALAASPIPSGAADDASQAEEPCRLQRVQQLQAALLAPATWLGGEEDGGWSIAAVRGRGSEEGQGAEESSQAPEEPNGERPVDQPQGSPSQGAPPGPQGAAASPGRSRRRPRRLAVALPPPGDPGHAAGLEASGLELELEVEHLRAASLQADLTAAQLQAANEGLEAELGQLRESAQGWAAAAEAAGLRADLLAEGRASEQRGAEAQLAELRSAMRRTEEAKQQAEAQLASLADERDGIAQQRDALAAELDAAASRAAELEGTAQATAAAQARQQEAGASALAALAAELEGQRQRAASLEGHLAELHAQRAKHQMREAELRAMVEVYQQREAAERASGRLAARSLQRRALLRWREAAEEQVAEAPLLLRADAARRRRLLRSGLAAWHVCLLRSRLAAALEARRGRRLLLGTWRAWQQHAQDASLERALDLAGSLVHCAGTLRRAFAAWRQQAAATRQVDLHLDHPVFRRALELRARVSLHFKFQAWRRRAEEHGRPKARQAALASAHHQRRTVAAAFQAWGEYLSGQRQAALDASDARLACLEVQLETWRQNTREQRRERELERRSAAARSVLLTRRAWEGFRQAAEARRAKLQAAAEADALRRAALQRSALLAWRQGARSSISERAQRAQQEQAAQALQRVHQEQLLWGALSLWAAAAAGARRRSARLETFSAAVGRRTVRRAFQAWRVEALDSQLAQSRHEAAALQLEVDRSQQQLQSRATEAADAARSVVAVSSQAERLLVRVASLTAELAAAAQRASGVQQELADAIAQRDAAAAAEAEGRAACAAATSMASAAAHAAAQAQEQATAAEARSQQAAAAAAEAQADAAAARSEAAAAKGSWEAACAALDSAQAESSTQAGRCEALRAKACVLARELERTQAALAAAQQQSETAEAAVQELQSRLGRAQRQLEAEREASAAATSERAEAVRQAGQLAAVCEGQGQECAELSGRIQGLQGALLSQLELEEERTELRARCAALTVEAGAQWAAAGAAAQAQAAAAAELQQERAARREAEDSLHLLRAAQSTLAARAQQGEAATQAAAAELAAREEHWQRERLALQQQVEQLREELRRSSGVLDSFREALLSRAGHIETGQQPAPAEEALASPQAAGSLDSGPGSEASPAPSASAAAAAAAGGGDPSGTPQPLAAFMLSPHGSHSVSGRRLAFLLDLVVSGKMTTSEAQEVITAAAEGDVRPLLHVLQMAKRGAAGSPQLARVLQQQELAAPEAGSPPATVS